MKPVHIIFGAGFLGIFILLSVLFWQQNQLNIKLLQLTKNGSAATGMTGDKKDIVPSLGLNISDFGEQRNAPVADWLESEDVQIVKMVLAAVSQSGDLPSDNNVLLAFTPPQNFQKPWKVGSVPPGAKVLSGQVVGSFTPNTVYGVFLYFVKDGIEYADRTYFQISE